MIDFNLNKKEQTMKTELHLKDNTFPNEVYPYCQDDDDLDVSQFPCTDDIEKVTCKECLCAYNERETALALMQGVSKLRRMIFD